MRVYLVDVEGHSIPASQTAQGVSDILYDASLNWGIGQPRHELEMANRQVFEKLGDRKIAVPMSFAEIDPYKSAFPI